MTRKVPRARRRVRKLCWTEQARTDLEAIGDFIARDDPRAAARWVSRLMGLAEKAVATPAAGRVVPEFERDDVREFLFRNYRLVYRLWPDRVDVLTVFEGHRRFSVE